MSVRRLALFIDYQNVYQRCRSAFGMDAGPNTEGQIDPVKVGRLVASRESHARTERVFVYRGLPDARKNPVGHAACRRQTKAWRNLGQVEVHTRALQYRDGHPPREKGVDVQLAIACVAAALSGKYDIISVFSGDSDLAPALEFVYDRFGTTGVRASLVAWTGGPRIQLQDRSGCFCHRLTRQDYGTVCDTRDYGRP